MALPLFVIGLLLGRCTLIEANVDMFMPSVQPKEKDVYLCMALKLNETSPSYIVGFEPHSDHNLAHHMLIYGCETPGYTDRVWDCGEMRGGSWSDFSRYDRGDTCASGPSILYAWALDAPSLPLPPDVAFRVGGGTGIRYLVLQVHYKKPVPKDNKDSSGISIITSPTALPKRAGIYLLGTLGTIPAQSTVYLESACLIDEPIVAHPFAYRAHTHGHGKVVSGYRVRDGRWVEIGRVDPRLPQMFYNVTTPGLTVTRGDILAARCTMKNDGVRDVFIGSTQADEMCNLYVMYWVDHDTLIADDNCFSLGFPQWSWTSSEMADYMNVRDIPSDASTRPHTGEVYPEQVHADRSRWSLRDILRGFGTPTYYDRY